MGLCVTFVNGPRHTGKTAVVRAMLDNGYQQPPHYIRMKCVDGKGQRIAPVDDTPPPGETSLASSRFVEYHENDIYQVLPVALDAIYRKDRYGAVIIEADADPVLRCAYNYDHRIFVMPLPSEAHIIFRSPNDAAAEVKRILDDTHSFASEIFGMFSAPGMDDSVGGDVRPDMTDTQMRGFLQSPLGDELITRIQLQPAYHGLIESNLIIVNTGVGQPTSETEECMRRLRKLMAHVTTTAMGKQECPILECDPTKYTSADYTQLVHYLLPFCHGGINPKYRSR